MKYDAIFYSPHLDDAILSAGGKIIELTKLHKKVCVVTVFTNFRTHTSSRATRHYLHASQIGNTTILGASRISEDIRACKVVGADYYYLDLTDGSFRTTDAQIVYPDYNLVYGGVLAKADTKTLQDVYRLIKTFNKDFAKKGTQSFGPLGIGNHIDHLIISSTLIKLNMSNVLFWEDVPYRWDNRANICRLSKLRRTVGSFDKLPVNISTYASEKKLAVGCYKSQLTGLKQSGLNSIDYLQETYYQLKTPNRNFGQLILADTFFC